MKVDVIYNGKFVLYSVQQDNSDILIMKLHATY